MNLPPDILIGGGMLIAFILIVASLYAETKCIEYMIKKNKNDQLTFVCYSV